MRRCRPDLYPSADCLSCQHHEESQSYFWTCPSHQEQWRKILNNAADVFRNNLQHGTSRCCLSHELIQVCLHESRTFISKGIIPTSLFELVSSMSRSTLDTNIILAKVYN